MKRKVQVTKRSRDKQKPLVNPIKTAADYAAIDANVPTSNQLDECWEQRLVTERVERSQRLVTELRAERSQRLVTEHAERSQSFPCFQERHVFCSVHTVAYINTCFIESHYIMFSLYIYIVLFRKNKYTL